MDRSFAPVSHTGCHSGRSEPFAHSLHPFCAPKFYCLKSPPMPELNLESHADRVCGKKFVKKNEHCLLSPWGGVWMGREEKIIDSGSAWFSQAGQNCIRPLEAAVLSQPRGNGVSALFIQGSNHLQLP